MAQLRCCRDRKLVCIIEALVEERPDSMQLIHGNESIPIADSAPPTGPCMKVVARQSIRIRNQRSPRNIRSCHHAIRYLLRIDGLPIEENLRIEFAGAPTPEHAANIVRRD